MAAVQPVDKAAGRVLLPDNVVPSRYDIRLVPDLVRFVFDGKEKISVDVREATNEIVCHAKELQITCAKFTPAGEGAGAIDTETIALNMKKGTVAFTFGEVLPVGAGVLEIEFVGCLNNQMAGFYRSSYKDITGATKIMASTQFESLDARRCFVCWDEPARKAVFAMTLVVDAGLTAFSNMPEQSLRMVDTGSKKEIVFMDSPLMSTYLVAICVGEFDFVQRTTEHGVLVRVYTPPGRSEAGTFALDVGCQSLDIYDDFFGLPYPLPKLDMVAIPEFAMGAMENWGLVTYREVDLLIDKKTASSQQKQRVCIVVTHELAHQWFGNLVTMAWWDDLWLNEGFASWCENYAADLIFPDYQLWDQFPSDTLAAALRLDALKTSHPIQVPIAEAEEVEEVFDAISYCKGAAVIRMAHAVMGHDKFAQGLRAYMAKHQYSNTETFNLWDAWAESSGLNVKEMMSSWTEQMGYPLVTVKSMEVEGQTAKLSLEQSWFLSSGEAAPDERLWSVPIFAASSTGKKFEMMPGKSLVLEVPVSGAGGDFVLLNEGVRSPIRVAYTAEMRAQLVRAIGAGAISATDRSGLVMDAYALAKAGKLGPDEMIRFLAGFRGDTSYVVWDSLSQVLMGFQKLLMGGASEAVYARYVAFCSALVRESWDKAALGWETKESDGHNGGLLRGLLMKLTSKFSPGEAFLSEARRRFARYIEAPEANANDLPDEYRVPVFQTVLAEGGEPAYRQLLEAFGKLSTNVDEKHVFVSVGFPKEPALKEEALAWSISGEVKIQDFFYIMSSVSSSSKAGLDLAWAFFNREFAKIFEMVKTASPSIMDSVVTSCCGGYCSAEKAAEIEQFFEKHPLPNNKRKIGQMLEEIRANGAFLERVLATDVVTMPFWDEMDKALAK